MTTYLAMTENGTPQAILCDRGGQFIDPSGVGTTQYQTVLAALGIRLCLAYRTQSKGKTVRILNPHFKVPDKYIGWSVWVANSLDQYIEIRAGNKTIATSQL